MCLAMMRCRAGFWQSCMAPSSCTERSWTWGTHAGIDYAKAKQQDGTAQQDAGDAASDIWSMVDLHSEQNACPNASAARAGARSLPLKLCTCIR